MKRIKRFVVLMAIALLLSMTSPGLAQVTNIAQVPSLSVEQQARNSYAKGQFTEAAQLFQQAAKGYQAAKDPIRQALSLSNLSLCYQQLGQWDDANRAITESVDILNTIKDTKAEKSLALAQALDIRGGLQLARGQAEAAFKSWEGATSLYSQLNKPNKALTSQVNQAQAFQNLGLYKKAISLLETALKLPQIYNNNIEQLKPAIEKVAATPETATALRTLGESLRVVGSFDPANLILSRSLAIAQQLKLPEIVTLNQISLGNLTRAQISLNKANKTEIDPQTALNYYQQAAASGIPDLKVQAQVNQLSLLVETKQLDAAKALLPQVQQQIAALPASRSAIASRVNLAQTMIQMQKQAVGQIDWEEIAKLLAIAVKQAKDLGDVRIQADAIGSLGHVYEQKQQWADAEKLTQQAVQLGQQINAGDIAYRWQWQLGRVLKAQDKTESAIAAYKEAVGTIKSLRADLAAANPDLQFSFREAVEPIHRQLVALLVESNQKDNLKTARDVIEGLQLVELDNFFREACLNGNPAQIDQVDRKAAVIYPIILENQLAIIASLPNSQNKAETKDSRDFRYYKTPISRDEIEKRASRLRRSLNQDTVLDLTLPQLQKMYDLVVRPEAEDLAASQVETLVFVLDGVLRNIPIAALHDGKQYLVEKYSIALTPGLQLLAPRSLKQERLGALVGGLSEARSGFEALPNVEQEVKKIKSELPAEVLINQKFTSSAFQSQIAAVSFPIVHLATHGQFSSQADETFILTWDGKIKVNELSGVLKTVEVSRSNSLELLVLSACETAAGDDRSALGLAGVAVRSGARSTVATLWRVDDQATAQLMSNFYDQLVKAKQTGISKAEALRLAQIAILKNPDYQSPYFWGAFVLLGNWT
ncbi:CHAT domain-containing protein [Tolypothrix sp. PCC 7910]|uniref:CHAT domain-containing protein n=1 Tax=Tolypothrix sp. PCC 7910 TaxID=2099387 RepID=UPI001FCBB52C|nr:CHAT domain-containing protein [Tolypothrix sp. PCC 7910]